MVWSTTHIKTGSLLTKGDSGSWVFQKEFEKVYGYIIATNGKNHAYMVPMHAAIAEIQNTLGAVTISLAISTDPRLQVLPGTTGAHIEQTDRSMVYPDIRESVQMSSDSASVPGVFSSPSDSGQARLALSSSLNAPENSPSHFPRPYQTTVASPAGLVASVKEELTQVEQIQVETQSGLPKDASIAFPPEQPPQSDLKQQPRDQNQELDSQESSRKRKFTSVTLSQEKIPKLDQKQTSGDHSKSQTEQKQARSQESLNTGTSVINSHQPTTQMSDSQLRSDHSLARNFLMHGPVVKAIPILLMVVEAHKEALGPDHPTSLASQHELAVAYIQNGETPKAVRILEHVVEVEAETLTDWAIDRLTSRHELARAYLANSQVPEAIKLLEDVVKVKCSTLGKSDPHLLASQIVLAEAYLNANRATDAISTLKDVVASSIETSSEHERIRSSSQKWLNFAHMKHRGLKGLAYTTTATWFSGAV